jgi:hypothetical protein
VSQRGRRPPAEVRSGFPAYGQDFGQPDSAMGQLAARVEALERALKTTARNDEQAYLGSPSPHGDTHKGGSDNIISSGTPTTIQAGVSAAAGTASAGAAAIGHVHDIDTTTGSVQELGTATSAGTGAGLALKTHVHKMLTRVMKAAALVAARLSLNFIEGGGVGITAADNAGGDRVDVTLTTTNQRIRLHEGTQADLSLAFASGGTFPNADRLGFFRYAEGTIQIPSTTTGDGGLFVSLLRNTGSVPRGILLEGVCEDDEGIAALLLYNEDYSAGLFLEAFGSATAGDSNGQPKATTLYCGAYGANMWVGCPDEFDLILATDSVERVRVDATDGYATFAHNLATTAASPAQITATQNDYNPANAGVLRLDADAARSITGMVAATSGTQRLLVNVGANAITLEHQDAGSAEANRFLCASGADIVLAANEMALAWYDATTARWRAGKLA